MTELGGSAPISEATVEAGNWMTALTRAREAIGESGGVPPGASCSVAPDGKVTIHDAVARKTYVLAPNVEPSVAHPEEPRGPEVPVHTVRRPSSVPPSGPEPLISAPPAKPAKGVSKRTVAYDAKQLGIALPGASAGSAESQPKKVPQRTIAYDANELGLAPSSTPSTGPSDEQGVPRQTVGYDVSQLGPPTVPSNVEASSPAESSSTKNGPPPSELLHSRDEEPTKETPLLYRERVYVVSPETPVGTLESILRARFEELQQEISQRPRGKLVNMALFDHRWVERPERPPLATLRWKDWRGEPVIRCSPPREASASTTQQPALALVPPASQASASPGIGGSAPGSPPKAAAEDELDLAFSDDVLDQGPASPVPTLTGDDRLASAFEALQDLFFLSTAFEGLDFVMSLLEELIPSEAGSACLYDINTDELRFAALRGLGADDRKGDGVPRVSGLIGAATLAPGSALLIDDVASDPRYDPGVDGRVGLEPKTMVLIAISHQGRLMGLLQLINRQGGGAYTGADANLLAYVAGKLGEFLQTVRMRSHDRPTA